MDQEEMKCVVVLDGDLPHGVAANTAAILGITLGRRLPGMVGEDVADASGRLHPGITRLPVPVLRAGPEELKGLWQRLGEEEFAGLVTADFSDLAQHSPVYEWFTEHMGKAEPEDLRYLGVALCGEKRKVNRLTGSLPLLR